jgi:putative methionine-R-sulfoxide reductase with GAF domain
MDPHSILDPGQTPELTAPEKPRDWPGTQANDPAAPGVRFPGEDSGKSLAGMAQKDLTATLQLLAEQAQYITGASGAAIALRDRGEMVCRASAGSSAPEVGSLLQVDSGLSGESVRTRQTLRCDDAATDPRVNRESCEALGIASVVVMPLVQGNEVIGVFELFSEKAHVFQGRDITALERMGTMVFAVLEHAMAAHGVRIWPERTNAEAPAAASDVGAVVEVPEISAPGDTTAAEQASETGDGDTGREIGGAASPELRAAVEPTNVAEIPGSVSGIAFHGRAQAPGSPALAPARSSSDTAPWQDESEEILGDMARAQESPLTGEIAMATENSPGTSADREDGEDSILDSEQVSPATAANEHMSAERPAVAESADAAVPIRSAVASLKKCEACGFPVSEGRRLCLDCEKKQAQQGNAGPSAMAGLSVSGPAGGPAQPVAANESALGEGPRFLSDEQEESSWLASHKYMVVAIMIAVIIIGALLLAR